VSSTASNGFFALAAFLGATLALTFGITEGGAVDGTDLDVVAWDFMTDPKAGKLSKDVTLTSV
jgi:hypothetical protein